jgi:hypothetical protein
VTGSLTLTAAGINSIRFIGGSTSFPNSLYVDNISATLGSAVPEPHAALLLALGLAGVCVQRRKSRS